MILKDARKVTAGNGLCNLVINYDGCEMYSNLLPEPVVDEILLMVEREKEYNCSTCFYRQYLSSSKKVYCNCPEIVCTWKSRNVSQPLPAASEEPLKTEQHFFAGTFVMPTQHEVKILLISDDKEWMLGLRKHPVWLNIAFWIIFVGLVLFFVWIATR